MLEPIRGLRLFSRTSDRHCWSLASWHSPHSMTWRWSLSFHRFKSDEWRVRPLWWGYIANMGGLQWGFRIPWIGMVTFHKQHPMWYRDLYRKMRDESTSLR